ncbi:hypothetical protein ACJDT4_06445 [Clostridium neuense]|uniref:Spore coat protein n=1 Tax=Clostridium neuense TaxID=1728934 RepID=A0ABW8TEB4_9CLOT
MSIYRDSSELSNEHTDEKDEYEANSNPCFYCPFLDNDEAQSRQYHHRPIRRRRRRRRPFYNPYYFMPYYFDHDYDYDDYDDYYSDYYDDYY